jgi:hypothetical protein
MVAQWLVAQLQVLARLVETPPGGFGLNEALLMFLSLAFLLHVIVQQGTAAATSADASSWMRALNPSWSNVIHQDPPLSLELNQSYTRTVAPSTKAADSSSKSAPVVMTCKDVSSVVCWSCHSRSQVEETSVMFDVTFQQMMHLGCQI